MVKAHIDELNRTLPEHKKIKLTLSGHSMGGGLASYAALRNKVPAVAFNPMRLGWGACARVGQTRLLQADKYLTEVVAQGDWVSDNHAAKLYELKYLTIVGAPFEMRGPLGNARRFMVPNYNHKKAHTEVQDLLQSMSDQDAHLREQAPNLFPHLQDSSARAQGDMIAGDVQRAVFQALCEARSGGLSPQQLKARRIKYKQDLAAFRKNPSLQPPVNPQIKITRQQARKVTRLVQMLIMRKSGDRALTHKELLQARTDLKQQVDELRAANRGKYVPVVEAIRRDCLASGQLEVSRQVNKRAENSQKLGKLL